jgi:hypothetical protein
MAITDIPVTNDEIEVICDLLWFIKREAELPVVAEALWQRLQPIRHGDFGGTAQAELSVNEAVVVVEIADVGQRRAPLDDDETVLVTRLRSLLG